MHRRCGQLIGVHIIIYSAAAVVLSVPLGWIMLGIGLVLIWISVVDCLRFEIPDAASATLVLLAAFRLWIEQPNLLDHILGAVIWPALFLLVAYIYSARKGRDGLGFGDVKLMVPIGLLCGFTGSVYVVLGAAISGVVVLAAGFAYRQRVGGETREEHLFSYALAFGPFLCFATWVVLLFAA